MKKLVLLALVLALVPIVAQAASITTLFAANNRGTNGGMVYFDVNVTNPLGLRITSFDVNNDGGAGSNVDLTVFTRPGTYVGNTGGPGGWTNQGMASGTSAGPDNPTPVNTPDFVLTPGTYGFALQLMHNDPTITSGHAYTNGTGGNQFYSNADISLTLGGASNTPWGSLFSPRVWNGTVYYDVVPEPASLCLLLLGALALRRR